MNFTKTICPINRNRSHHLLTTAARMKLINIENEPDDQDCSMRSILKECFAE